MPEEINFLQLTALLKITPNTVLERFGSSINASIFDASNLAGSLKQNGLIDFTAYYPGPNEIVITDAGKALIAEAEAKSAEPFDTLDETILVQLSGGKRIPVELQNTINIRPRDMALRLYKLYKQGFIIYELKSGGVDLLLTEAGFLKVNASGMAIQKPRQPAQQPQAAQGAAMQAPGNPAQPAQMQDPMQQTGPVIPPNAKPRMKLRRVHVIVIVVVVVIVAAVLYAHLIAKLF